MSQPNHRYSQVTMKTFQTVIFSVLVSVAAHAASSSFEGRINLLQTEGKTTVPVSYLFKGAHMRIEMTEGKEQLAVIINLEKRETIMIMAEEKMYMVTKFDTAPEVADASSTPVKTGRTEKILGHECEEYTVTEKKTVTEYWAAKGLGVFRGMKEGGPGSSNAPSAWEIEAEKNGLFPLRIVERNSKGKELSRTEATLIEPGKLDDSLFVPPKDFQKFEMPSFGNMLGG